MIMFYKFILNLFQYKKGKFLMDKIHQCGVQNSKKKGRNLVI